MSPPRRSCIFPGCHSVQGNGSVSLFKFPSDDNVKKRWIDFVKRSYCGEFKITTNTRLCSVHFTPDSYSNYHQVKSGFLKSPLMLVSVAEPTVTVTGDTCPPESSPPTIRGPVCRCGGVKKETREIGCQTDGFVRKRTVATQLSKTTLVIRNRTGYQPVPNMDQTEGLLLSEQLLPERLHIKEEPETLSEGQEGNQTNSAAGPVKCEDEEEKPQASQLHWRQQTLINIKEEPSSCTLDEFMTRQSVGINSKGPEAARNPDPSSLVLEGTDGTETDSTHTEDGNKKEEEKKEEEDDGGGDDSPKPLSDFNVKTTDFVSSRKKRKKSNSGKRNRGGDSLKKPLSVSKASNMMGSAVEKPFRCFLCGKCFKFKWSLTRHKVVHTGEKPFKCDVCSKGFSQKSHLVQHFRSHTGEKPYGCNICSKCFKRRSELFYHMKVHTQEKPFRFHVSTSDLNKPR